MYSYTYSYEARFELLGDLGVSLAPGFAGTLTAISIVVGILALALLVFTAVAVKRARVFGIIAAVLQPLGFLAGAKTLVTYASVPWDKLDGQVAYSSVSTSDAISKLMDQIKEIFIKDIAPHCAGFFIWSAVLAFVSVITVVYSILLLKEKGKGLALSAMILGIIRFAFISPIELTTAYLGLLGLSDVMGSLGNGLQGLWSVFFTFMMFLPVLLLAVQGLIVLLKNAKAEKAAAAAVVEVVEEAAAEAVEETAEEQ